MSAERIVLFMDKKIEIILNHEKHETHENNKIFEPRKDTKGHEKIKHLNHEWTRKDTNGHEKNI